MLQNTVAGIQELHQIKVQSCHDIAHGKSPLTFASYKTLLLSATSTYNSKLDPSKKRVLVLSITVNIQLILSLTMIYHFHLVMITMFMMFLLLLLTFHLTLIQIIHAFTLIDLSDNHKHSNNLVGHRMSSTFLYQQKNCAAYLKLNKKIKISETFLP